jgi:hypothetical protein
MSAREALQRLVEAERICREVPVSRTRLDRALNEARAYLAQPEPQDKEE